MSEFPTDGNKYCRYNYCVLRYSSFELFDNRTKLDLTFFYIIYKYINSSFCK